MPAPRSPARVAVLGGGITGLTAAWQLRQAGLAPTVFERSAQVGGAIGALRYDGWLHELGPNSMLEGTPELAAFVDAVGLGPRRLYAAPEARHRFIVRRGRLLPMPTSPMSFARTDLFSWPAKLKLLGEPWRRPSPPDADESVAQFVARRLGREFLDYAINPFVGGVYAGDPAALSVRHAFPKLLALEQQHGSLIRGALKRRNTSGGPKGRIFSFPEGLGELPAALAAALGDAVHTRTHVRTVRRIDSGWRIEAETAGHDVAADFDAVVCALPADALSALRVADGNTTTPLATLREIQHPPVASVFTGFKRSDISHPLDGFGALMPAVENGSILGTLFSSTLFPGRAPAGHVALTTFVGGTREPWLASLDDEKLLGVVQQALQRLLGVTDVPVFTHIQRCPRAIPQYTLGYERFKDTIAAFEASAPGIFVGGNARDGISLANCIDSGRRLATAVENHLGRITPRCPAGTA